MLKKYLVLTLLSAYLIVMLKFDFFIPNILSLLPPEYFIVRNHNEELTKIIKTSDSEKIIRIWDEKLANINQLSTKENLTRKQKIELSALKQDLKDITSILFLKEQFRLLNQLLDKFGTIEANKTNLIIFKEVLERVTLLTTDKAVFLAAFYEEDQAMWKLLEDGANKQQAIKGVKSRKYIDQDLIKKIEDFKNE